MFLQAVALPPPASKWNIPVLAGKVEARVGHKWKAVEADHYSSLRTGKPRFGAALGGFAISGAYPIVSALCEANAFKALLARVFRRPKHTCRPGIWEFARGLVPLLMPGFQAPNPPLTVEEWLSFMPGRRKTALTKAAERYSLSGWKASYGCLKSFIKTEKLAGYKAPEMIPIDAMIDRLIQSPADEAHVIAGPFMRPLVLRLKDVWGLESPIFYASRKPKELQAWLDQRLADGAFTAFAVDYSMFDNSHSRASWGFMEALYRDCGSDLVPDLLKVLKEWRTPHGYMTGDGYCFKYQADVMNCTGRDDTSLANGVLNGMCIFLSATAAYYKVDPSELTEWHLRSSPIRVAVSGDDSLGFMPVIPPAEHVAFKASLSGNIGVFGFDADGDKIIIVDNNPLELVFLGMRPYPVGGRWLWGRTIGRALFKFGWKVGPVFGDLAAWFAGECTAICENQLHVPILSDFCAAYLRSRVGCKVRRVVADEYRPWTDLSGMATLPYDASTIRAVSSLYSVTPEQVLDCIGQGVRTIENGCPCVLSHPVLERCVTVDEA